MSNVHTVLFDVDGVLIDTEKIYQTCWLQGARQLGYVMQPQQALQLRSLDSRLACELFEKWYQTPQAYPLIRAARKQLMADYLKQHPLSLKSGVLEALRALKNRQICLAVVTASDYDKAVCFLREVGIAAYFTHIISTKMVPKGKPFPDVYQYACQQLGKKTDECIAVEDSPNGVHSAHTAGCRTIMIPDLTPYIPDLAADVDAHYENLIQFVQHEIIEVDVCKK